MFKQSCKRQNEKSVCFTGIVGVSSECQINQRSLENLLEKHHNNMQSLVLRGKKKKKEREKSPISDQGCAIISTCADLVSCRV